MSFTIPDVASAWNAIQARVQSGDFQILADGAAGVGVLTGAAVTPQGSPNMTVAVASGTVRIGGSSVSVSSGNVTITANATGNPRLDLICVDGSGTKTAQAGTAAATPKYPAIPGSSVVLAAVLVPTGASSITANNIVDKRVTVPTTTGLLAANNLSDVSSATSARTNLGLGTMATQAASAVDIRGGTITGLGTPSASGDAAPKSYVDALSVPNVAIKTPCRVATTTNITLSGTPTIDGVTPVAGDRVLVKNQTTASQNGIYVVAAGAWSRSTDADTSGEVVPGIIVSVAEGVTSADRVYTLTTDGAITLNTTALTFAPVTYAVGTTSGTVAAGDDSRFSFPSSVTSTLSWKQPCRAATTANITLSGTQTIDGVSVVANDRVLVKNQTTGANNGIYVAAAGAWSRATDMDTSAEVTAGMGVVVTEGTVNGDVLFLLTTNGTLTLGSTSLAFAAVPATIPTSIGVALSDETTTLTTGTAKVTIRMPYAMTLTGVRSSVNTVSSSGLVTVDIKETGTTVLSTLLSIDATEKTSTTAATPAVISDTSLADDAEITFDITAAGTGARGLKIWLIGTR